jgi:hypothetical protein
MYNNISNKIAGGIILSDEGLLTKEIGVTDFN